MLSVLLIIPAFAEADFDVLEGIPRVESATTVAWQGEHAVVAGPSGAWRLDEAGVTPLLRGHIVQALTSDRQGRLWLGTSKGLWQVAAAQREASPVLLGPGDANDVRCLAAMERGLLVGTAMGLWWRPWEGKSVPVPALSRRSIDALAANASQAAVISEGRLYGIDFQRGPHANSEWDPVPRPLSSPSRPLLDLAATDEELWLLAGREVLRIQEHDTSVVVDSLPAGVDPVALFVAKQTLGVATDRGLYQWNGGRRWHAVGPSGVPFVDAVYRPDFALAVGPHGAWRVRIEREAPVALQSLGHSVRPQKRVREPSIEQVHLAVVRAQGFSLSRLARWRRRATHRGVMPEVELRVGYGRNHEDYRDYDQSFTSGALRDLANFRRERERGYDLQAVLRWDLGDAQADPEEVDVAKEVREWIELRDEVLDEVTRLYFERQAALADAHRLHPNTVEREQLERRAAERAAGLDAWTAGWWSAQVHSTRSLGEDH